MDKNTILAIVLSTLVIVAGFTIQTVFFPPEVKPPVQETALPLNEAAQATLPAATVNTTVSAGTSLAAETVPSAELPAAEEISVIETNLVRVEFTNRGGDIVSYKLKQHGDAKDFVEMAEFTASNDRAFSIALGDSNGAVIDDLFNVKKISDTAIGFYRTFTVRNQDGTTGTFTLAKQYTFLPDDYMFELKVIVDGQAGFGGLQFGNAGYTLKTSPQIGPEWDVKHDKYEYRRFYHLLNGKPKKITLGAGQNKVINETISWAGVTGKYFTLVALPDAKLKNVVYSTVSGNPDQTRAQISLVRSPVNASSNTDTWKFYLGPRTDKFLTPYNTATNNPYGLVDAKLDQIVESSGILGPLEILLKWIMEFFYKLIPNWGVSIIILTILMRFALFPLTKKSSEASHRMQELQPKMQEIQTKYKENPQKMNEEMAKFYQSVGYNPLSGCLPLLIQFPLIFAMYNLFNNYFEFRGAMFIPGWIPDLSQGDSVLTFGATIPFIGSDLRILPIIYLISQMLFGKVTQTPTTAQQSGQIKFMMYGMPLIFFFLFYNAPAGLLLYWTFSNLLTLVQQVVINRMMQKAKENGGLKLVKK